MTRQTTTQLREEIAQLKGELSRRRQEVRLQVSAKGAVSVYGIRRFPITFYHDEWDTLFSMREQITTFMDDHSDELKSKGSDNGAA